VAAEYESSRDPGLKPGSQAAIRVSGATVGVLGELHPDVARAFELPPGVFLFEINLSAILTGVGDVSYQPLPRFPSVERDLALVVDGRVNHRQIADIIDKFRLVTGARLFDVYTGKQVAAGKKSLAYSLTFQSPDHTLKDAEVDGVLAAIVNELSSRLGAALRV
jgi:phenylalanyl-tRNA synthetase beta chain